MIICYRTAMKTALLQIKTSAVSEKSIKNVKVLKNKQWDIWLSKWLHLRRQDRKQESSLWHAFISDSYPSGKKVQFTQQSPTWPNFVDSPPVDKQKCSATTYQLWRIKTRSCLFSINIFGWSCVHNRGMVTDVARPQLFSLNNSFFSSENINEALEFI